MTDYTGAKLETPWHIGIVDRRENDGYIIKLTNRETGRTREDWWRQEILDDIAAGREPGCTLTIPKPDPQAQLRERKHHYD